MKKTNTENRDAVLFTGADNWTLREDANAGVLPLRLSDGPHGLRIERRTGIGFNESHPATAYPTASLTACSFDRELQYELGEHLAEECIRDQVQILLGPGVNHKRSPLCGRNFEYYSEDPYLSGELASAYVNGVQAKGIGTSLKHFAGNSREYGRMVEDSIIDERALQELYLSQFERVIRKSRPWTLMCAYNQLNGTYCCEHKELMDLARTWGFDGAFISDWGAVSDPSESMKAGLNLEMPGGDHGTAERIVNAVQEGKLDPSVLKKNTARLAELSSKCSKKKAPAESEDHTAFARRAAEESAVLMKNKGALPITRGQSMALIGTFAKLPRIQGTGSSKVNPKEQDCLFDAMKEQRALFSYAPGFSIDSDKIDRELEEQALKLAERSSRVIVCAGLPEGYEAEGYDRRNLNLPENQNHLIQKLARICSNVIVVLHCGAPVIMPWFDQVNAVLCMYLGGCRSGEAGWNLLSGKVNPSGKLAETWPKRTEDVPCARTFRESLLQVQYRESIFSGYRYYDKAKIEPACPFGHGLSYTSFRYADLKITPQKEQVSVAVTVTNTGERFGKEVVQLYIAMPQSRITRCVKELKGFEKVALEPGQSATVSFVLDERSFAYFDTRDHAWKTEAGSYLICVGSSSRDIRLEGNVFRSGTVEPYSSIRKDYLSFDQEGMLAVSDEAFAEALGRPIPPVRSVKPFTGSSSIYELQESGMRALIRAGIQIAKARLAKKGVTEDMILEAPIRSVFWISSSVTWDTVDAIANVFNGTGTVFQVKQTLRKKK